MVVTAMGDRAVAWRELDDGHRGRDAHRRMVTGRLEIATRGEALVFARGTSLVDGERDEVLSATQARAVLGRLSPAAQRRLVEACDGMFPTTPEPERSQRILDHVAERLDTGALFLLRRRSGPT